ncbi:MAG: hypothetical protein QXX87_05505 [Candidatus Jordarchaeales archaeon]
MYEEFLKAKAAYIVAKAAYEDAREKASKANRRLDELLDAGLITADEWAERTAENDCEMGVVEALQKLIEAENRLIEVGRRLLEERLTGEEAAEISEVWNCKLASVRKKVVDVLLRWDPSL